MGGGNDKRPRGEVGILQRVEKSNFPRTDRCFLFIDYEGSLYVGCLLCSDQGFCNSIVRVLEANLNKTIAAIGSLDINSGSRCVSLDRNQIFLRTTAKSHCVPRDARPGHRAENEIYKV